MKLVNKLSFIQIQKELLGKRARFKSDCEFFPKFDVMGRVTKCYVTNGETILEVLTLNNRQIKIGSKIKNIRYELLN